jgi:hypothetical protein
MDREIEHFRIVREVARKPTKKLGGRVRIDINHGTAHARETSLPLEIFLSRGVARSFSQKR